MNETKRTIDAYVTMNLTDLQAMLEEASFKGTVRA